MQYLLLVLEVCFISAQSIITKQYNKKCDNPNPLFFSGMIAFAALCFFVIASGFKLNFSTEFVPYSIAFGVAYAVTFVGSVLAIAWGSLAITNLITNYSLIIPALFGVLVFKDDIKPVAYIGIVFLIISLFLITMNNNSKENKVKMSLKWAIAACISFVGNGMCSVVQKLEQIEFSGGYTNEFMIVALAIATVIIFTASFLFNRGKKLDIKKAIIYGIPEGISNAIVNFLTIVLIGLLPSAILFPTISAGGIVIGFFVSVYIYKERLSKRQLIGYAIGVLSVILLNM